MELRMWGKTIISVQKYLGRVTKAIDSLIHKKALASGYVSLKNLTEQSSFAVSNFILNLSERKVNLINLNTICINALKGIDRFNAKLLILKHIDCLTSAEISSILGISNRTYFRKLNLAYDDLKDWLEKNNFTDNYFNKKYKNEGWIYEVYKEEIGKNSSSDFDILKNVIKNLNKQAV